VLARSHTVAGSEVSGVIDGPPRPEKRYVWPLTVVEAVPTLGEGPEEELVVLIDGFDNEMSMTARLEGTGLRG
jgi:hypothetical protein